MSEIDELPLLRDVTHTALADFRPLECYARIRLGGEWSAAWFLFDDDHVTCEAQLAGMGVPPSGLPYPSELRTSGPIPCAATRG